MPTVVPQDYAKKRPLPLLAIQQEWATTWITSIKRINTLIRRAGSTDDETGNSLLRGITMNYLRRTVTSRRLVKGNDAMVSRVRNHLHRSHSGR